jgi:hypothetical protein
MRSMDTASQTPSVNPLSLLPHLPCQMWLGCRPRCCGLSLDSDVHSPGKRHTQKIERKHLT